MTNANLVSKARPLSHDEALRLLEPAVRCRVEVVVTPAGPTDATMWVARVRVKERGSSLPWLDAATGGPCETAGEARGQAALSFLAEAAGDARGEAEYDDLDAWHCDRAAALAALGRLGPDASVDPDVVNAARAAFDAAFDAAGGFSVEEEAQRLGWRAFVLSLVPALRPEG